MGYLYRPKLKSSPPAKSDEHGKPIPCTRKEHGRENVCPGCGAQFGKTWWLKYYVNGEVKRVSTETEKETEARKFMKDREGKAVNGVYVNPHLDRIRYEEIADDLKRHYETTGCRNYRRCRYLFVTVGGFFKGKRVPTIGNLIPRFVELRQSQGAANGSINRELALISRMLTLALENGKLLRMPVIHRLKEAPPREGFFEREAFESVKRHLRPDLQVAASIEYAFGWRTQSEVLTLRRNQVDLGACTLRLNPGTTKNDDGRVVYLTPELVELITAQEERVQILEMQIGRKVEWLFPYFKPHAMAKAGDRIRDFRHQWFRACLEATLDQEQLEGEARSIRRKGLIEAFDNKDRQGLLKMLRHDFRRTAVRKMVNRGVPERVAMKVTGHRTRTVFDRYHIVSPGDLQEVARKLTGTFSGTLPIQAWAGPQ